MDLKPIVHLKSISQLNALWQRETKHPLLTVVDFSKVDENLEAGTRMTADFYTIMFKNYCVNKLRYGRQDYDFQDGSLICIAPKQVVMIDTEMEKPDDRMGWGLFFHPDLLRGTSLGSKMHEYTFFSYETSEALHLAEKEKEMLFDCVQKIESELHENIDDHSQTLLVSNIELLLNYCSRYYGRQFITRKSANSGVVAQVESYLKHYFSSENSKEKALPSVKLLANEFHLSANYLSDLLKKETGLNAQDHIHYYLIEAAKNILVSTNQSVSEIAHSLGFDYPQYFSKLFKQKTGSTPLEYRSLN